MSEEPLHPTVLVVDDNPRNLTATRALLEPLGARLLLAASGEEALRCLLVEEVAVILLDVAMPGMSGFETASLIKGSQRSRDIPIIFVSAEWRETEHAFAGYRHGAVDYLQKPVPPEILRSKVAVFLDLFRKTERLKRQAALLRQQSLSDLMPLCLWLTSAEGRILHANRAWQELAGDGSDLGRDLAALEAIHPDDRDRFREAWQGALERRADLDVELRFIRRGDGVPCWHLIRATPEKDSAGWIVTATDIDVSKQADRAKDEFLATISHELRTPLTAILGWASLLRGDLGAVDGIDPSRQRFTAALAAIERCALAQRALVDDLVDLSRIATGKLHLSIQPVDLTLVVSAAVTSVLPVAATKRIAIDYSADPVDPLPGDPARLQQVAANLLTNAVKFTPEGGRVEIALRRRDDELELSVSDTGCGIPADVLPHIFEPFRQADGSSARVHGGLGLGLAIVREIVGMHGGRVEARSSGSDLGATFVVSLPVRRETPAASPSPVSQSGSPSRVLEGLDILLVEDNEDARAFFEACLEREGAVTRAVTTVRDALEALGDRVPDVLLSDIALPREDGFVLIEAVRRMPGKVGLVPAAALTAFAGSEHAARTLSAGFQAHVAKPVDPGRLVEIVARLARQARL